MSSALAWATLRQRSSSQTASTAASSDSEESVTSLRSLSTSPVLQAQDAPHVTIREDRDFIWTLTEEPHRSRRMQIIKDHPEVSSQ